MTDLQDTPMPPVDEEVSENEYIQAVLSRLYKEGNHIPLDSIYSESTWQNTLDNLYIKAFSEETDQNYEQAYILMAALMVLDHCEQCKDRIKGLRSAQYRAEQAQVKSHPPVVPSLSTPALNGHDPNAKIPLSNPVDSRRSSTEESAKHDKSSSYGGFPWMRKSSGSLRSRANEVGMAPLTGRRRSNSRSSKDVAEEEMLASPSSPSTATSSRKAGSKYFPGFRSRSNSGSSNGGSIGHSGGLVPPNIIRKPAEKLFGGIKISSETSGNSSNTLKPPSSQAAALNKSYSGKVTGIVRNVADLVAQKSGSQNSFPKSDPTTPTTSRLGKEDSPRVTRRASRRVDFANPFLGFAAEKENTIPLSPPSQRRRADEALDEEDEGSDIEDAFDNADFTSANKRRQNSYKRQGMVTGSELALQFTPTEEERESWEYPRIHVNGRQESRKSLEGVFVSDLSSFRPPPIPSRPSPPASPGEDVIQSPGAPTAERAPLRALPTEPTSRAESTGAVSTTPPPIPGKPFPPRSDPGLSRASRTFPGSPRLSDRLSPMSSFSPTLNRRYATDDSLTGTMRSSTLLMFDNRFHPSESSMSSSMGQTDVASGLCGLKNLGNTCYMNSIIQCLSGTTPLVRFFSTGLYRKFLSYNKTHNLLSTGGKLAQAFATLLKEMRSGQSTFVVPLGLLDEVGNANEMFQGGEQQDSQEFLSFILNALHEDLKHPPPVDSPKIKQVQSRESSDEDDDPNAQWHEYQRKNQSVIVDLFQLQLRSKLRCPRCGFTSETYSPEWFLTLPVPKTKRRQGAVDLEDCLDTFLEPETLTGDNQWNCPKCKMPVPAEKQLHLGQLPHVLMMNIKRFEYNGIFRNKIESLVTFPERALNLNEYVGETSDGPYIYDLYAVSNHYGGLDGGHYTAIVYNGLVGQWHYFDDTRVSVCRDEKSIVTKAAYNLFYVRRQ